MSGPFVVFCGATRLFSGSRLEAALAAQHAATRSVSALIFDAEGRQVDFDLSGSPEDLAARLVPAQAEAETAPRGRGRGRPRLGVTAREVTLLPRHWDWLAIQPGGASVALRKLVEVARRDGEGPDRIRSAREATYRFASAMAGDLQGFEEAMRALFAGDAEAFTVRIAAWPEDLADQLTQFAAEAFGSHA